jgi:hypothetical protein
MPPQLAQNLLSFWYEEPGCAKLDNTLIAI